MIKPVINFVYQAPNDGRDMLDRDCFHSRNLRIWKQYLTMVLTGVVVDYEVWYAQTKTEKHDTLIIKICYD